MVGSCGVYGGSTVPDMIVDRRLRWLGHVGRMEDGLRPKKVAVWGSSCEGRGRGMGPRRDGGMELSQT